MIHFIGTALVAFGTSLLTNIAYDAYYQRRANEEVGEYDAPD